MVLIRHKWQIGDGSMYSAVFIHVGMHVVTVHAGAYLLSVFFSFFCELTELDRGPGHTGGPGAAQSSRVLKFRDHLRNVQKYANENKQMLPKHATAMWLHLRGEVKDTGFCFPVISSFNYYL